MYKLNIVYYILYISFDRENMNVGREYHINTSYIKYLVDTRQEIKRKIY